MLYYSYFCYIIAPSTTESYPVALSRGSEARIATHAHAMPPATQPAVTRASPIPFGCRMLDGQVLSDEEHHEDGLRAGQVANERAYGLSFSKDALVEKPLPAKTADYILTALSH